MDLHSEFLIHWTDRKFLEIKDAHERRNEYVKRLRNTCEHGFYMKREREEEEQEQQEKKKIWGVENSWLYPDIVRVCFSEIRLSQAHDHAGRYGELGIGVHRSFILEREGNPVFYVQSGAKGHMVQQIAVINTNARLLIKALKADKDAAQGLCRAFQQALKSEGLDEEASIPDRIEKQIQAPLMFITGYVKNMSDRDSSELKYYDEMEWRVVLVHRLVGKYIFRDKDTSGVYRLPLSPQDVRIIVFWDGKTRQQAQEDESLRGYFKGNWPMMTTLEECGSF